MTNRLKIRHQPVPISWQAIALAASLVAHYLLLASTDLPPRPDSSMRIGGGAQPLPLRLHFSMAPPPTPTPAPAQAPSTFALTETKLREHSKPVAQKVLPATPKQVVKAMTQTRKKKTTSTEKKSAQKPVRSNQPSSMSEQALPAPESIPVIDKVQYRHPPRPPVYPRVALKRRQQGEVLLKALVNENGKTENIKLIKSSGYAALDDSALRAVSGWEFEAARSNGNSIRAWIKVPVEFYIR
jgi:periplasmic protein TonB